MLVDDCDAELHGVMRAIDMNRFAAEAKRATVRPDRATNDLHQRRFAGAILANKPMNLANARSKAHSIERPGRPIALGDIVRLERELRQQAPPIFGRSG